MDLRNVSDEALATLHDEIMLELSVRGTMDFIEEMNKDDDYK